MKQDNLNFDKMDAYLFGQLDAKEEENFLQQVQADEALAKALDARKRLHRGLIAGGRRELKAELKTMHQEIYDTKKPVASIKKINWRSFLAIASLILVGLLAWWFFSPTTPVSQQIFAANYQPFSLVLTLRDADVDPRIDEAVQHYQDKEYQQALPLLKILSDELDSTETDAQLQLAYAISSFETKDYPAAFHQLSAIIQANDPFLSDLANWYSALFHLQLNQTQKALPHLQTLADDPGADKHLEAQKILMQIK